MKFKSFEIRKHDGANKSHAEYEIVKWDGSYCFVVAFVRWNDREPCWQFDCVGMRFIDHYENGLCEFIAKFMELADIVAAGGDSK